MLYSISDVARVLGVSVSLIKVRIGEGKLKVSQTQGNKDTRYFEKGEVERFANECGYVINELEWLTREDMINKIKELEGEVAYLKSRHFELQA